MSLNISVSKDSKEKTIVLKDNTLYGINIPEQREEVELYVFAYLKGLKEDTLLKSGMMKADEDYVVNMVGDALYKVIVIPVLHFELADIDDIGKIFYDKTSKNLVKVTEFKNGKLESDPVEDAEELITMGGLYFEDHVLEVSDMVKYHARLNFFYQTVECEEAEYARTRYFDLGIQIDGAIYNTSLKYYTRAVTNISNVHQLIKEVKSKCNTNVL